MELRAQEKSAHKKTSKAKIAVAAKPEYEALIEQYLPFATSIANKVSRALSSEVDYDDILCNARLGLLEAAKRFDNRFNVDFKTFAYYRIKGAVYDGLRKTGWIPRSLYSKIKFDQAANEYLMSMSDKITRTAETIGGDVNHIYDTVNSLSSIYVMSLDSMEDFEVEDQSARRDIEHKAEFQKIKEKMRDSIEALPDKERKLVKMYYFQNKTLQEIGERLGLSKSWTCRLHARALDILFKKLTNLNPKFQADAGLGDDVSKS